MRHPTELLIRPSAVGDADAVVRLLEVFANENPSASSSAQHDLQDARRALCSPTPDGSHVAVAQVGGHVCGLVAATLAPSWAHGGRPIGFVTLLVVDESWRRQGIATELLRWVGSWASAHDAYKLLVEVRPENSAAIALYGRRDFVRIGDAWALYLR